MIKYNIVLEKKSKIAPLNLGPLMLKTAIALIIQWSVDKIWLWKQKSRKEDSGWVHPCSFLALDKDI